MRKTLSAESWKHMTEIYCSTSKQTDLSPELMTNRPRVSPLDPLIINQPPGGDGGGKETKKIITNKIYIQLPGVGICPFSL